MCSDHANVYVSDGANLKVILEASIKMLPLINETYTGGHKRYSMKTDVLTLAAVVFVGGLLLSSISFSEIFQDEDKNAASYQDQASR